MIISDFHTHSTFSTDGNSPLEEMVSSAVSKGVQILCCTEHMDYHNHNHLIPSFMEENPDFRPGDEATHFQCDTARYLARFNELKEQYRGRIDLRFGMELGLQPDLGPHYAAYVREYPFDFIIGSSHEAGRIDPYYKEYTQGRTPLEAYRFYFETELTCAKACADSFDVYGHIDYALRYHRPEGFIFHYEEYEDLLDELLRFLIVNGKGIECNTKGYAYFGNEPNPKKEILLRYRELGGEILTVGSDAHHKSELMRNFDDCAALMQECGFKYYTVFKNRTPEFLPL